MHKITPENLKKFTQAVLEKLEINKNDAKITADILVSADLRGVASHGVARLKRYIDGLKDGLILKNTQWVITREAPTTAAIDAKNGLGQPVSPDEHKISDINDAGQQLAEHEHRLGLVDSVYEGGHGAGQREVPEADGYGAFFAALFSYVTLTRGSTLQ